MWEPADLLPAPASSRAAHPPGSAGPSGLWHDSFKMCKSAFKLGRGAPGGGGDPRAGWGQGSPSRPPSHWLLDLTPDSDSDDEDAHFFSVGASGAPQAAPESPSPHSQSTLTTLVTVLKGRVTALCETKVRAAPERCAPDRPQSPR